MKQEKHLIKCKANNKKNGKEYETRRKAKAKKDAADRIFQLKYLTRRL
jgi:hypothetical protein|tara:strand:+ start:587 stop:730 length:144 start_codon:yes stop_codon:yes gene_type:complete